MIVFSCTLCFSLSAMKKNPCTLKTAVSLHLLLLLLLNYLCIKRFFLDFQLNGFSIIFIKNNIIITSILMNWRIGKCILILSINIYLWILNFYILNYAWNPHEEPWNLNYESRSSKYLFKKTLTAYK